MKDIFELIIDNLKSEPFFADFKYRKRDSRFYISNGGVHKIVKLQRTISWGMFLDIYPVYLVRFDVLKKWFEKFSFKTLRDQRDNATVGASGGTFGLKDRFAFERGNSHNNEEYELLRDTVISCAGKVFNDFQTLEDYYTKEILPVLKDNVIPEDSGADWIFEYLTGCKIVAPENYNRLKEILLRHVEERHAQNEPNIMSYYDRMDEILNYLENYDFKV